MEKLTSIPSVAKPIQEFSDFAFVSWERDMHPQFKAGVSDAETSFFASFIQEHNIRSLIDFGVGSGATLSALLTKLAASGYSLERVAGNDVQESFLSRAHELFEERGQKVELHQANWLDLPEGIPPYAPESFEFGVLTGTSLSYVGGGTLMHTRALQKSVVRRLASLIRPGGHIFIDLRNYSHLALLMHEPQRAAEVTIDPSTYYHGFQSHVVTFPAYVSDSLVVMHFYDTEKKIWSKLDIFPLFPEEMASLLSEHFTIEHTFYDFEPEHKTKSLFTQYIAKKK
ncbi:MAG: class I SAM-dependent methyltransferase [Patescibacteria group bacterium]